MVNSPLIRPAISWGGGVALGGGTLDSHEGERRLGDPNQLAVQQKSSSTQPERNQRLQNTANIHVFLGNESMHDFIVTSSTN